MKQIRDAQTIIGMLNGGEVAHELGEAITGALADLNDRVHGRPKAKIKGKVTLTLDMLVENGTVIITPEIISKLPKPERNGSYYWLTSDGSLSTEHPQQADMFSGPREARPRDTVAN
jgi:hypothetical protein